MGEDSGGLVDIWQLRILVQGVFVLMIGLCGGSLRIPLLRKLSSYGKLQLKSSITSTESLSDSKQSTTTSAALERLLLQAANHPSLYLSSKVAYRMFYTCLLIFNSIFILGVWMMWNRNGHFQVAAHTNNQYAWMFFGVVRFICCNGGDASSSSLSSPSSSSSHRSGCGSKQLIVMAMMQLHGFRRLYECFRVHRFSRKSCQHIIVTAGGICFYLMATLTPVVDLPGGFAFGCSFCSSHSSSSHDRSTTTVAMNCCTISLGIVLFLLGSYHQHRCHRILADIRWKNKGLSAPRLSQQSPRRRARRRRQQPLQQRETSVSYGGEKGVRDDNDNSSRYSVPYGDWFQHVSSPHYLAEILIYAAFVIVSKTATQMLCFVWVASNLCITAHKTHRWYLTQFSGYEQLGRKAVIPLVL